MGMEMADQALVMGMILPPKSPCWEFRGQRLEFEMIHNKCTLYSVDQQKGTVCLKEFTFYECFIDSLTNYVTRNFEFATWQKITNKSWFTDYHRLQYGLFILLY